MQSYVILDEIELINVKRASKESKFFPKELENVLSTMEIGKGLIMPIMDEYAEKKNVQKVNVGWYIKRWAKPLGKEFVVGFAGNGVGIKRVK